MNKTAVVAGTGFAGRANVIRAHCREGLAVELRRDRGNAHDANAVAVFITVPVLFGLLGKAPKQIGFIKAGTAAHLAKKLDAGTRVDARVKSFYAPDGRDHPRVTIELLDSESGV